MSHHQIIQGQLRHIKGWKPDRPDPLRDKLFYEHFKLSASPPPAASLRSGMPSVKDQGSLGSCTAHGATAAIEYLMVHDKKPEVDLSRLFLYFASRVWVEGENPTEDSGCAIRNVMKALRSYGACVEKMWPYNVDAFAIRPPKVCVVEAAKHEIINYYRCPNLSSIKQSIADGYPVVIGFSVYQSMMTAAVEKTGIVPYPTADDEQIGGHCVALDGYDDSKKSFEFQNSWGTSWGDKGFGMLDYRFVVNGLANDGWTIRTALNA